MTGEGHADIEALMSAEWSRTSKQADEVRAEGGYAPFTSARAAEIGKAFEHGPVCVCCIDERVGGKMNALAVAASGLLLNDAEWETFKQEAKAAGITEVYLHEGCGAEALYAQMNNLTPVQAHEHAVARASELKTFLGIGGDVEVLPVKPRQFHNAQVAYITLTENFDATKIEGVLPPGFIISTRGVSSGHVMTEAEVANSIAFGDHGFGKRFTTEQPFTFVIVARTEGELAAVKEEPRLKALVEQHGAVSS